MFAAALQAGVDRSRRILGSSNFYNISTDITTFEFERALKEGLDRPYSEIRDDFSRWLEAWLKRQHSGDWVRPITSMSNMPIAISWQLDEDVKAAPVLHFKNMFAADIAVYSDGHFNGKYMTRFKATATMLRAVHMLKFGVTLAPDASGAQSDLKCAAYDADQNPIKFTAYVHHTDKVVGGLQVAEIFYCFEKPLGIASDYLFIFEYTAPDPYPLLGEKSEPSSFRPLLGDADEVTLIAALPNHFRQRIVAEDLFLVPADTAEEIFSKGNTPTIVESNAINYTMISDFLHFDSDGVRYHIIARRAVSVTRGCAMGFLLKPLQA